MRAICLNCQFCKQGTAAEPCRRCINLSGKEDCFVPLENADGSIPIEKAPDNVNHPFHYQGKYECIDETIALFGVDAVRHFCMCNVYKYRFRASRKNGPEDIEKAEWYMEKLMELNQEASIETSNK